jgi:ABC-type Mn2+/Zn2+ transport system ATPase subunit
VAEPLFAFREAAVGYGSPLLRNINWQVDEGQFWGIFGPNGAGKTTLVKTLLGSLKPLGGRVEMRQGVRVGYVPQLSQVRESMPLTVRQVIKLGALGLQGLPKVAETLARVGLEGHEESLFASLSGGQRQRVMVARALHRRPRLLILDEPTNGVDLPTRHALMALMRRLHNEGMTLLLVTHLLGEIGPEVGHFLWVDSRENLFLCGRREKVLSDPALEAAYGGGIKVVDVAGEPVLTWASGENGASHD